MNDSDSASDVDKARTTGQRLFAEFAKLPPQEPVQLNFLAKLIGRHPASIKRAVRRGELPPGVPLFGELTWLPGMVIEHLRQRLESAKLAFDKGQGRLSAMRAK